MADFDKKLINAEKLNKFAKEINKNYALKSEIPSVSGLATEYYVQQMLGGLRFMRLTQNAYDAITVKDPNTMYIIVEESDGGEMASITFANVLRGATRWQVFGDSISAGYGLDNDLDRTWHGLISAVDEFSGLTKSVSALTGSEVSDGGRDIPSFVERYTSLDADADLVTIFAGVNDWIHGNIPLGNYDDTTTIDSFYGALNTLIPGMQNRCPNATIVWLLPLKTQSGVRIDGVTNTDGTNAFGLRLTQYIEAIKQKCKQYKIGFVDLYGVEGLDPDVDTANFSDGLHPTDSGHAALRDYLLNHAMVQTVEDPEEEGPTSVIPSRIVVNSYHNNSHFNVMYVIDAEGLDVGDVVRVQWINSNVQNFSYFNASASFFDARGTVGVRTSTEDQCTSACSISQTGNWTSGSSTSTIGTGNSNDYPYFLAMTSFVPVNVGEPTSWDVDEIHVYVNNVEVPIRVVGGFFTDETDIEITYK